MNGIFESELGLILIKSDGESITGLDFIDDADRLLYDCTQKCSVIEQCKDELDKYFRNKLERFEVKISYHGTDFRKKVWDKLLEIPYGETISYKELAERIGNTKAVRAVGGANHHNPISIIVPCHRVIGSDNSLTGYGGGVWRKEWLLRHEKRHI